MPKSKATYIKSFELKEVGPFDDIAFEFDESVNVFVGANNSGKSCALICLAEIAVYPFSIPRKYFRKDNQAQFRIEVAGTARSGKNVHSGVIPIDMDMGSAQLEVIATYVGLLKKLGYSAFVPALRWGTDFRASGPTTAAQKIKQDEKKKGESKTYTETLAETYFPDRKSFDKKIRTANGIDAELRKRREIFEHNSSMAQDRAIVQSVIDLDYKAYRQHAPNIHRIIEKIPEIASEITDGFPISFAGVGEDNSGLYPKFNTPDGVMPLHALSQGTQSILHWIAHLLIGMANYYGFPNEPENCPGVLIVDEIDAHLHPSWQRRILPTLTKHFKNVQIFCSTHSPLMLAGLKRGQVTLLKRNANGGVTYTKNSTDIVSWSADEILRNILELQTPTDLATEEKLKRLESLREKENLSESEQKELAQLRNDVNHMLALSPASLELGSVGKKLCDFIGGSAEPHKPVRSRGKKKA